MNAPANGKAARRLERFKRLLAHARELLSLDFGFVLWDGSTVPADLASNALALVVADEGVVAAIERRPNADTLLNLWVTGRIDIRNGVIFDFLPRRPKPRTREIRRRLDKRLTLETALAFLFVPRGGPWPLEAIRDHRARSSGNEESNKENVHYHYDLSNAFYALFLDPEMVYSCAYFRDWNNDLATAQHDKLDMICRKLRLRAGRSSARRRLRLGRARLSRSDTFRRRRGRRDARRGAIRLCEGKGLTPRTRGQGGDRAARLHG